MDFEIIQVDKKQFDVLTEILEGLKSAKCHCGKKITRNNFGFIGYNVYTCNDIICQSKGMTRFENERGSK